MAMKVKEINYFLAWLLYWVSATICGAVVGGVAGGIVGALLGASGFALPKIRVICGIVGFLAALPFSYLLFRLIVDYMIVRKVEDKGTT